MTDARDQNPRWVVRLSPLPGGDIDRLLQTSLGLDVWERRRDPDELVVAADEAQIGELERRRLASVERLYTVEEYVSESGSPSQSRREPEDAVEDDEEETGK